MKLKRVLSGLLVAATLCSLMVVAPASAAKLTAFTDVSDPAVAEAAEILRVMGIVDGNGSGAFLPGNPLDRAAFCKMAVELMGNGDKVAAQSSRTIFRDVPSTHWANGYINVASQGVTSGGEKPTTTAGIIRGDSQGYFNPNRNITYAEAVTILMRTLGYSETDVGYGREWYDGFLSTAASIDLTEGVTASPTAEINRGQAAILFKNTLFTKMKGSESVYLTSLGGSLKDDAIILSTSATAADGTTGSVQTSLDTYRTDRVSIPAEMNGVRGKVALDKDNKLVAILPRETDSVKRIVLSTNNANYVTGADGVRLDLKTDVAVWKDGKATTYDKVWTTLKAGTSLVLCYNAGGQNDYLYVADAATSTDTSVLVLKTKPNGATNAFAALGSNAALYKNGMAVTPEDLRQYDVGVLDKGSNTVQISDRRLTGVYENASPNTTAPSTIRLMGYDFTVLPSAVSDLQSFKIGDRMTLLLTYDYRVAGVVTPNAATGTAVGIAQVTKGTSKVTLFDGAITLEGKNGLSETAAANLDGKLVTASSSRKDYLNLSAVSTSGTSSAIDLAAGTMGARKLADNAKFYDCIDGGAVVEVKREDIVLSRIPAGKISYVSLDYAGRVAYVVMDDVTGDCYEYGYLFYDVRNEPFTDLDGKSSTYEVRTLAVRKAGEGGKEAKSTAYETLSTARSGVPGGVAGNKSGRLVSYIELKSLKNVARSAFDIDEMTLTTTDNVYHISDVVECYNKTTDQWYTPGETGLAAAVGFADNLTVYYDKAPEDGGKIRMIVVE